MKVETEITLRPMLADRLQISTSVNYQTELDNITYIDAITKAYLGFKKEYKIKFNKFSNNYYIELDKYLIPFYSYLGKPQLRLGNPYTITTEFNFIRMIRNFIKDDKTFNHSYDKKILINEDNYINNKIWRGWDAQLIKNLSKSIEGTCKSYAQEIIQFYVPDFDIEYKNVTLKHAEFNVDYNVGRNKSSEFLHELHHFIISSEGVEWIKKLNSYALNFYSAKDTNIKNINAYGDLYNPTLKFYIAKGIFFKIYRKTTDDIRLEITFEGNYIKRKLKKQTFSFVYPILRKIAKEFFKKANFEEILEKTRNNCYADHFAIIDSMYGFLDGIYPELSYILDSICHGNALSNPEAIRFIRSHRNALDFFVPSYTKHGNRVYIFNPDEAHKPKLTRLKPPIQTKKKSQAVCRDPLFVCSECGNEYTGKYCPNCAREHWRNHEDNIKKSINWWNDKKRNTDFPYY